MLGSDIKPGTKVLILEEVGGEKREGDGARGQVAVYEGDFPLSAIIFWDGTSGEVDYQSLLNGHIKMDDGSPAVDLIPYWIPAGSDKKHPLEGRPTVEGKDPGGRFWFENLNPRFKLEDGRSLWGAECWWQELTEAEGVPFGVLEARLARGKELMRELVKEATIRRADE